METIHPYGKEDRVVSDLSRFEYEKHTPRNRSRNVTPTKDEVMPPRKRNMVDIAELAQGLSTYDMHEDLYNFYAASLAPPDREFAPYPPLVREPPLPPPKDPPTNYGHRNVLQARHQEQDLPPMQDSRDYAAQQQDLLPAAPDQPVQQHDLAENILLERVLNKPLFRFGGRHGPHMDPTQPPPPAYTVTVNTIVDFFQIIFGIIIITLASVLGSEDTRIAMGIYRYFIAVGVITLVVLLLFVLKTINFERRNGIFYCLLLCVLTGVSLVLSISTIATNSNCATSDICAMRKTLSTFSIVSFFFWICTLVMYLTTLYISRMNLLEDLNFEYSSRGAPREYNKGPPHYSNHDPGLASPQEYVPQQDGRLHTDIPQYYLSTNGQMYPILDQHDVRGTKKMMVYTLV